MLLLLVFISMILYAKRLSVYLGLLVLGGGAGFWGSSHLRESQHQTTQPPQAVPAAIRASPAPVQPDSTPKKNLNFIADAVQKVGPAVVKIDAAHLVSQQVPGPLQKPFFRRFFGEDFPTPKQRVERGTGSGFIISSDGHLITNAHVVEDADTVKVKLKDGRTFEAQVVGTDPITDIAALKIDANDLPSVKLGKSDNLTPGAWAVAIGNPLGLNNTVTVGIISALNRSSSEVGISEQQLRVSFIQTDAAINPGNSGGPLLDARGEVIGINTAIRANAQGLGFAIPVETAERIANQLFSKGKADHPYLGIQMVTLDPQMRKKINQDSDLGLTVTAERGVLIVRVVNNSPAERAGFQPGDIIQKVGSQPIETAAQVQKQVEMSEIGSILKVEIKRKGQTKMMELRPGAFPVEE